MSFQINIILASYNNYFNRKVLKEDTVRAYVQKSSYSVGIDNVNFNPGDGINTHLVVGTGDIGEFDAAGPDYLIEYAHDSDTNEDTIYSRWFVMNAMRTRGGQYDLTLRRDVIADNYDAVMASPCFIEKGYIDDPSDPLLYNNENMEFDQIKISETLLKDSTGCGWVVGYVPQDAFKNLTIIEKDVPIVTSPDITVSNIANWSYYNICSLNSAQKIASLGTLAKAVNIKTKRYSAQVSYPFTPPVVYPEVREKVISTLTPNEISFSSDSGTSSYEYWSDVIMNWRQDPTISGDTVNEAFEYMLANVQSSSTFWSYVDSLLSEQLISGDVVNYTWSQILTLLDLDGKLIQETSSGNIYRITVKNVNASGDLIPEDTTIANNVLNYINTYRRTEHNLKWSTSGNYSMSDISIGYSGDGYILQLSQVTAHVGVEIDNNRSHVLDAPYDMFCIPYSDTKRIRVGSNSSDIITCNKQLAVAIAQEIAAKSGSANVYDTQLLPYCPCQELITKNSDIASDYAIIDLRGLSIDLVKDATNSFTQISITSQTSLDTAISTYGTIYDENYNPIYFYSNNNSAYYRINIASAATNLGAIIWCSSITRSFDINETISVSDDALERKIENECDMYRLCSGNYAGMFEFSAAKSYGVNGFHVDCTFKPYNPYIHVTPKLTGLYGNFSSFKDARGLICGGDFSLAQLSNSWANYELQNKNYQNIFDRQIQNMDFNNNLQRQEAGMQLLAGTASGSAAGAITGAKMGGGYGAIAGAVIGGATAGIGGIIDYGNLLARQEETRDLTQDLYGYHLGNIKAIPTSLSKTAALNANTKIFPFVEKYTCTDAGKDALRDKITYNGMTIMKIGYLINQISNTQHFYKGQLIRLNNFNNDSHVANVIYDEINKGVYI